MNVTLKEAAALLHVRGEVCKALRSREWSWLELQALLKAESEAQKPF